MSAPAQWRLVAGQRHAFPGGGKTALCGLTPDENAGILTIAVCARCRARYVEQAEARARRSKV